MSLEPVQAERPRASDSAGTLMGQLRRGARPGATGEAQYGAAGVSFFAPPEARIALVQLTSAMTYPDLAGAGSPHFTVEPTPYATARQVWCHQFDPDDRSPGGAPLRSYDGTQHSKDETVWHPAAFRNADGYAIGHPSFRPGDRVFCLWNRQSGRWEILAPPLDVWRFELKTALEPGSWATACLLACPSGYDADVHAEFDVFDALDGMLRGRAKTQDRPGTRGYAKFMPDSDRWEILALEHQARWIRFALKADMSYQSATGSGDVLTCWDGYHPDPDEEGVTVANCALRADHYLFAGATGAVGLACYDPVYNGYRIVQMECH
jgi:hypothetical protein